MKKTTTYLIVSLLLWSSSHAQEKRSMAGTYTYIQRHYKEVMTLHDDGSFEHTIVMELGVHLESTGNWQQRKDQMILDSYPQRDRMIVIESRKKKVKTTTIQVLNKDGAPFHYYLFAILENGRDTVLFKDQWRQTQIKDRISVFWIIDSKGLTSPQHILQSDVINQLDVFFETKRVFENEHWLIKDGELIPRGLDGSIQEYSLVQTPVPM